MALLAVRDRLHRRLTTTVEVEGTAIGVGARIVAVLGSGHDRARDLLRAADEEMYRVKLAGRSTAGQPAG